MYFPILPLMPGKMFCLRLEICLSCHVLSSRLDIVLETGHLSFGSLPFFPRPGWLCFMTSHSHLIYEAFACAINFCWLWLCSFNIHKFLQPRKTWRKINRIKYDCGWKGGLRGSKLISTAPKLLSFILATPSTKPHRLSHTHFPLPQPANCFMCQDLCLCPCFFLSGFCSSQPP